VADNLHAPETADSQEAFLERVTLLSNSALDLIDINEQDALDLSYEAYNFIKELNVKEAALVQLNLGIILHRVGKDDSYKYLNNALSLYRNLGSFVGMQKCYKEIGHLNLSVGNYRNAEENLLLSLRLARDNNLPNAIVDILNLLAGVYHYDGRYDDAETTLKEVINLYKKEDNYLGIAKASCNLGILFTSLGNYDSALTYLNSAYDILTNKVSDERVLGIILNNLGRLFFDLRDYSKSIVYYTDALKKSQSRHDKIAESVVTRNMAASYKENAEHGLSKRYFLHSLELCVEIRNTGGEVLARAGLAEILIQENQGPQALENLLSALPIAEELQDLETQLEILNLLGQAYALSEQWPEAGQSLNRGLELAQEVGRPKAVLDAHRALYGHYKSRDNLERALHHFEAFYHSERALLTEESDKRVRELSAKFDLERAQQETLLERLLRATAEDARNTALEQVAERTLELEQAQIEIVSRLALAAEFRDDITGEHTLRVGRYSAAVARHMGLDPLEVALIEQAARLHDVGKIGVPDSILLKPGNLTSAEYEFMKAHTLMGGRILSGGHSRLVKMAEAVATSHHERWDGTGYPKGTSGENIPLEGRIVAVADVFDALMQGRPYKKAWSKQEAWAELKAQSGKQFDPAIIEIFGCLLEEGVDEFSTFLG